MADTVQTQIDSILARLQVIDGQGLPPNLKGQIDALTANFKGLKKELGNVNLGYQTDLVKLWNEIAAVKAQLTSLLQASGIST